MDKKIKEIFDSLSFLNEQELEIVFYSNIFENLRLQRYYDGYEQGKYDTTMDNCFGGIDDDY